MTVSNNGADQQKQKLQKRFVRLLIIIIPLIFAIITAAILWPFHSKKAGPLTSLSSDLFSDSISDFFTDSSSLSTSDSSSFSSDPTPTSPEVSSSVPSSESSPDSSSTSESKPSTSASETTPGTSSSAPSTQQSTPATTEGVTGPVDILIEELLRNMTLREKVYQLFIVTPEQLINSSKTVLQFDSSMKTALKNKPVGGVIFFSGNILSPTQVTAMVSGLQKASGIGLFIAVDEEGGTVARIGNNPIMGTTSFSQMAKIGASGNTKNARNVGLTIGKEIKRFGFNLDFAPVADVNSNPNNTVIGNRAFSSDPHIAADMVAACVSGFKESGMLCTLKHFPGHGDTATDSHYGAASSGKTLSELQACEFLPFKSGIAAGADLVMIGHISLPNVTGNDLPATLSHEIVTGILREQLGFDGLVVTDSMSMAAITNHFSSAEAAVKALQAGVDIILMPKNLEEAVNGILQAVENGELSEERIEESVYRILYSKSVNGII